MTKQTGDFCTSFCRCRLTRTMEEVRKFFTVEQRKQAWAWRDGDRHVEFHGPDNFYWYGSGCCLWDARTRGWEALLEKVPGSIYWAGHPANQWPDPD